MMIPSREAQDERLLTSLRESFPPELVAQNSQRVYRWVTCNYGHHQIQVPLVAIGSLVGVNAIGYCPECGRLFVIEDGWADERLIIQDSAFPMVHN